MTIGAPDAARLEADALEYPDERGEILLDAAVAWRRAGYPERAAELLVGLAAEGGEDGCYARRELVEDWFQSGEDAAAASGLAQLACDPALHEGHCQLVAELLVARGDLGGALEWYDRAVARLAPETVEAVRGPDGWAQLSAAIMLWGRREVRRQLGLPADAMDEITPTPPAWPPVDLDGLADQLSPGRVPRQVRMLVVQRAERAEARLRWPQEYGAPDDEHYPAAESRWRDLADRGVPSIRVVPATVQALCAFAEQIGGSPTDSAIKTRFSETIPEQDTLRWPPPRNSPCWCGSPTKYKKCCGRARTTSADQPTSATRNSL
jgi:tetratricopeptide (TPR) repeat protein